MMAELIARAEGNKKYVEGIAVPWNQVVEYQGEDEYFMNNSVKVRNARSVPADIEHFSEFGGAVPLPVGVLVKHTDTEEGFWASFKMATTEEALKAWQLVADGVYKGMSVYGAVTKRGTDNAIKEFELLSVAITSRPVYSKTSLSARSDRWHAILANHERRRHARRRQQLKELE